MVNMSRKSSALEPAGLADKPLGLHLVNVGSIPTGPTHGEGRLQPHPGDVLKPTSNVPKSLGSGLNLEGRLSDPQIWMTEEEEQNIDHRCQKNEEMLVRIHECEQPTPPNPHKGSERRKMRTAYTGEREEVDKRVTTLPNERKALEPIRPYRSKRRVQMVQVAEMVYFSVCIAFARLTMLKVIGFQSKGTVG